MNNSPSRKRVVVHLGPHKTGSSAIQKSLDSAPDILERAGICFLRNFQTHDVARALAAERFGEAKELLTPLSEIISASPADCVVLSQEDFCGRLIGNSPRRRTYPKLTKNLRILARLLKPHDVTFAFFLRQEDEWLRSCYHQHLKYRTRFCRYEDFEAHYGADLSWGSVLERPTTAFGKKLVLLQYSRDPAAGLAALLKLAHPDGATGPDVPCHEGVNTSPTADQIAQLERINEMTEFGASASFAKSFVLTPQEPRDAHTADAKPSTWPPRTGNDRHSALPKLMQRMLGRVSAQDADDILPPVSVDLAVLARERLPKDVELPELSRKNMHDQAAILNYHLRGKSGLSHLNALTISYLRRDTPHTAKARLLFHRVWREQGPLLVNELSTRWLISTLQTFLDHGETEAQRAIGTAGFFYANMMKIYEGERAIEGAEQDAVYSHSAPQTSNRFRGLDRYKLGGTDLMLNTNALALEIARRDATAGLVLEEFLLRVKHSGNVFSRHDKSRACHQINVPGFTDTWSFFETWPD